VSQLTRIGVSLVFSLICLGLGGHLVSAANVTVATVFGAVSGNVYYPFTGLAVATSVIHLISVVPMIVLGFLRPGAFTSFIVVEISWLSFMWVLWLATGALAASTLQGCGGSADTLCSEGSAITAFGFLSWIILMAYSVTLLVLSIIAHTRGQTDVWTSTVTEGFHLPPATMTEKPVAMQSTAPTPVYSTRPAQQPAGIPEV
ncbi:hypothetical protein K488DRAFT_51594, partial [Vararia minispora EC-137]